MAKIYFVLNNRNNVNDGYKQVTREYAQNYKNNRPNGEKVYFICLGYAYIEVDRKNYLEYKKECSHTEYISRINAEYENISYDIILNDEYPLAEAIPDEHESVENSVSRNIMLDQVLQKISMLDDGEKELIQALYFDGKSEESIAREIGVNQSTVSRKKAAIIKKLKSLLNS